MKILLREYKSQWFYPIIIINILIILILSYWYFYLPENNEKLGAILSGLITGFVALIVQLWFSWEEQSKLKKYDDLKIINILAARDDDEYYRPLIKNAKKEIKVLGVTCLRFLEDFANYEASAPERNKILLNALDKNKLKVMILVADESCLDARYGNKAKVAEAKPRLEWLSEKYPNCFFYRFYKHNPTHSVMVIDDESIVGPIFPDVSSKYSPAIHLKNDSKFVEHYRAYFDKEWDECSKN
jgi:hypothetical protein